jgi:hypothetical protein
MMTEYELDSCGSEWGPLARCEHGNKASSLVDLPSFPKKDSASRNYFPNLRFEVLRAVKIPTVSYWCCGTWHHLVL